MRKRGREGEGGCGYPLIVRCSNIAFRGSVVLAGSPYSESAHPPARMPACPHTHLNQAAADLRGHD